MTVTGTVGTGPGPVVPAAGALPWRRRRGRLEVLLVHRPRYDDWAWSKGKLDDGEEWPVAAVREVLEETGLLVRLGRPLPPSTYRVLGRDGQPATKSTRYWAAEVIGGDGRLVHEIDEVDWLGVAEAAERLTYSRDRDQLRAVVRADKEQCLTTWPLVVVRHAHARPRSSWQGPDPQRPLDQAGRTRAAALVPLLAAYAVDRLVSSPSARCTETLTPYAADRGLTLRLRDGLSEEGYAERPDRAVRHLARVLERGGSTAFCSHGPVLPELLEYLATTASDEAAGLLRAARADGMTKGEALVAHVVGTGAEAKVTAVERHLPQG